MGYLKLDPVFQNIEEIRMGSPFNICDLKLEGKWIPELPRYGWQDKYAKSDNGRYLALVAWAIENNNPAFRLILIDIKERSIRETNRIDGCCESIKWSTSGFSYKISSHILEREFTNLKEIKKC